MLVHGISTVKACGSGQEFVHEFAFRAGTLIFMLIGGVSVIAIMWAAIGMSLSVIDEQEREKAKNSIKYAFMGLMFAIMGGAIVQMVAGIVKDFVGG